MTQNLEIQFKLWTPLHRVRRILAKPVSALMLPVFLVGVLLLDAHPSFGETRSTPKNKFNVKLNPVGISPSAECGKCHKDIYESWRHCLHAQSVENPIFRTAYLQAHFKVGEVARKICLTCHAPVAYLNGDFGLAKSVTREGVNCDYCHTISKANPDNPYSKYHHDTGLTKQGPLKNVKSPVHETLFNPLFKKSTACAGCHEFVGPSGLHLIETFSEWKKSPYSAKGVHCQNCHMRKVTGKPVAEEILKTPEEEISTHDISAGHALSLREKSLTLDIKDVSINRQKVVVIIEIKNQGAGHKIPTGLPTKKIILQVAIKSKNGEIAHIQQKVYQKLIADGKGKVITDLVDLMLDKDLKILSDNRIKPMETRREQFTFFVRETAGKRVTAEVFFSHTPEVIQPSRIHIKMNEATKLLGD
jgi:cytochrome c554/c'-like protein